MAHTAKQTEALNFIIDFIDSEGYSPSVREVADGCSITVATAYARLERLRAAGAVTWQTGKFRTLRVAS